MNSTLIFTVLFKKRSKEGCVCVCRERERDVIERGAADGFQMSPGK